MLAEREAEVQTYRADIYVGGDLAEARRICREFCADGLCVTVEPIEFIYTGGSETGVRVGLINYPRFPSTPEKVWGQACELARMLVYRLYQWSALVESRDRTLWISTRKDPA